MNTKVLYYPTIEFMDETWLKASLCVWDKIYRIVPESYQPKDSDEVKIAIEHGVVENIVLNKSDLSQTADQFINFIDSLGNGLPAGLIGENDIGHRLHPDKMDARVFPILKEISRGLNVDGFLEISGNIANLYMLYLSNVVSDRRGISKLTDNGDMFAVMNYFSNDGNSDERIYNQEAVEFSSSLAISSILPKGIESTRIEKVLEFRDSTKGNRQHFKESIDKLIQELTKTKDESFSIKKVDEYITKLEENNSEIAEKVKDFAQEYCYSMITVGLPMAATTFALLSEASDYYDLIKIGGSCFVGAFAAIADASRSRRKIWRSQDSFYYHQLHNVFGGEQGLRFTLPNYNQIYEEFIND